MASAGIDASARDQPAALALADAVDSLDWARLRSDVDAVATAMTRLAGETGRIAVTGDNSAATLVAHAAGMVAGVGTVAISRQLTAGEMVEQLADAGAVALVSGPGALSASTEAARSTRLPLVVHGADVPDGGMAWSSWTSTATDLDGAGARPAHPLLVYTSGTTGRPRGTEVRWVSPTPATAAEYVDAITARASFPPGPHLVVGPLQHNGPLTALRHLMAGQPVVVFGRFDAEDLLRLVERHRVTSAVMVPTHFQRLLELPSDVRSRYDVSSLTSLAHTGSACPPDVKRAMIAWVGPILTESYGGSEVGTLCRITSPEWQVRPASVGRAVEPYEVVVVGPDGEIMPTGETGVLGFRAPADRGPRYLGDAEKTAKAYLMPGVFTLGDVGHVDADGFVFITDRVSDMVLSGGVNLYPAESERVLRLHPLVAEVAVIGVPDADLGEALHALVVPTGGMPDPAELQQFCRASLAAYKCPRSFEMVSDLPRNAMGKLDKRALRAPYWADARTIAG